MARPRSVSDGQILAATERVVARLGPIRFTLADVGREVGLTAPALLKRFESKRALLLALSASTRGELPSTFARRRGESALGALLRALREQTRSLSTPRELANGLAFLELDVTEADFHAIALDFFEAFRRAIQALLDEAVASGELRRCDTEALARAVEIAWNGSLISWGIWQEGTSADAVARDVEAVLAPFRTRRRGRAVSSGRARRRSSSAGRASHGR